jgi:hypothetical protein
MQWSECSEAFRPDEGLRDLYVHGTSLREWQRFLSFLASSAYQLKYTRDGEPEVIPRHAADVFADREPAHHLSIQLGAVTVCCYFFTPEEIELDIDPREVRSQQELDIVMSFMSALGATLLHDVILTEENAPDYVWFRYSHSDGKMHYRKNS